MSLPEMMIAMAIALVLMLGIGQIFLSSKQSYNTQSGMGALQENARFAIFFLQRDLRRAGFPRTFGPGGSLSVPPFVTANTLDGASGASDQIELEYSSDPDVIAPIGTVDPPDATNVIADNGTNQDCLGQSVMPAGTYPDGTAKRLTGTTANDTTVLVRNRYYVADLDGDGISSLYCLGGGNLNNPQPIVNGVESFQVLYGEDTDGDTYANVYRAKGAVTNWNNVVAVRVALLLNSTTPVAEASDLDSQQYAVLDAPPITPVDNALTTVNERRYRRRVFTSTIEIRNKDQ
jgi:type IV pilus assembly protein PilW